MPQARRSLSSPSSELHSPRCSAKLHYSGFACRAIRTPLHPPVSCGGCSCVGNDRKVSSSLARLHWRQGTGETATVAAVRGYMPKRYQGELDLFVTADRWHQAHLWRPFASGLSEHYLQRFEVNDLLLGPHVNILAGALQARLDQIRIAEAPPGNEERPVKKTMDSDRPTKQVV